MKILTECSFLTIEQLINIEDRYNAKYVFESQLKLRSNNWSDFSAAVFYTVVEHPRGSNWFGIWKRDGKYMISNAISAVDEPFFGIVADNKDVIYSRNVNDCRESPDKSAFIAGGRDRPGYDMEHHVVKLKVDKDKIIVLNDKAKRVCCEIPYTEELDWDIEAV